MTDPVVHEKRFSEFRKFPLSEIYLMITNLSIIASEPVPSTDRLETLNFHKLHWMISQLNEIAERVSGRRVCSSCGEFQHVKVCAICSIDICDVDQKYVHEETTLCECGRIFCESHNPVGGKCGSVGCTQ